MIEHKEQLVIPVNNKSNLVGGLLGVFSRMNGLMIIIPLVYMVLLTFVPIVSLFKQSLFDESGFTLRYLAEVVSNPLYLKVMWLTLKISFLVTVISLLISYPVAYLIVQTESTLWKKVILSAVLIPFWISLLVRTFSWNILLQDQGVINKLLMSTGLINEPLSLLFNTTGVVIAMTHILMPYMVLSLYSVMQGIDQRLVQASQGLGAKPSKAFYDVFLPLSAPGIIAGCLLVFVLSLGFYITPALLGGSKNTMIAMLIENNINITLNWNLASALSLLLFFVTILLVFIPFLLFRNHSAIKDVM